MERRDHIIDVFMALISERQFEEVTPRVIAVEAGISLAELRAEFATRGHIIDAFARRIDGEVLSGDYDDMMDEAPRERLFDVMMSRIEALRPYRLAMGELIAIGRRDPAAGLALNAINVRSTAWDMAAAGLRASGWRGRLATQGLAASFVKVLRKFVQEEDVGLPQTMAALDKELREGESTHKRFTRVFGSALETDPAATAKSAAAMAETIEPVVDEAGAEEPEEPAASETETAAISAEAPVASVDEATDKDVTGEDNQGNPAA